MLLENFQEELGSLKLNPISLSYKKTKKNKNNFVDKTKLWTIFDSEITLDGQG